VAFLVTERALGFIVSLDFGLCSLNVRSESHMGYRS
jgi:hypothetical protein